MVLSPAVQIHNRSSGQIMVEALISIAILILTVFGLVVLMTASVKNSTYAKDRSAAHFYALQRIEEVRNGLIVGWGTGFSSPRSGISGTNFSRTTVVRCCPSSNPLTNCTSSEGPGCDRKKITVTIDWQGGSNTHNIVVSTLVSKR